MLLSVTVIIGFLIVCYYVFVRRRIFAIDPFTIFFFSMIMYMLFVPLAMRLTGNYNVSIDLTNVTVRVSPSDWNHVTLLGCLGIVSGSLAYQAVASFLIWPPLRDRLVYVGRRAEELDHDTWLLFLTTALFLVALVSTQYDKLLHSVESYQAAVAIAYENSTFSFLRSITAVAIGTLVNHLILTRRHYLHIRGRERVVRNTVGAGLDETVLGDGGAGGPLHDLSTRI